MRTSGHQHRPANKVGQRHVFPAVEFRDTSAGRLAFVQGTRVPVFLVHERGKESSDAAVAEHYGWPAAICALALAYGREFPERMTSDAEAWRKLEDELPRQLPTMQVFVG